MNFRQKTIHGMTWAFTSQIGRQVSQFVVTVVLARLLAVGDFGLLGMATVFISFVTVLNEKGLSGALIQKQDATETHYNTVFWLNVVFGLSLMGLLIVTAPWIARFYGKPELEKILVTLSVVFVIASVVIVHRAILAKSMDFKRMGLAELAAIVFGGAVGITLAFNGFGVWSLVFQVITFNLATALFLWCSSSWRPRFSFSFKAVKELFGFSSYVTLSFVLNYVTRNIDYLLIGKFLGAELLGYYTLAYKLMLYPIQNITWVIGKVLFPAFSRIQDDLARVREASLKMGKAISLVMFPILCGMIAVAPDFVAVLFGPKWQPSADLIRILCICGLVHSVSGMTGSIAPSQGRPDLLLKLGFFNTLLTVLAISFGLRWGLYGVAWMYTLAQVTWVPFAMSRVIGLIDLKASVFFRPLFKSLVLSLCMMGTVWFSSSRAALGPEAGLALWVASGVALYCLLLRVFEWDFVQNHILKSVRKQNV